MVQRRSRQGAAEPARIRIISAWSLVGVTLMVAAGLVLLFPKQALMERLRKETGNDTLTANYLANLLRTEPSNQELRVLLAEKHMAMGKAADAREALAPLLASPDDGIRRRALMLDLRIAVRDVQARKQGDPGRAVLAARAAKLVAAMAGEAWAPQELVYLTRQARALGDAALAGRLIARLLERRDSLPPAFLTESAAIELGEGDYREASLLYFAARDRTADPAERRELWFKGVAALQSGNLPAEALAAAERHLGA